MTSQKYDVVTTEELFSRDTGGSFPVLIEIRYGNEGSLYFVNDTSPVVFDGKQYEPASFSITFPSENGKSIPSISMTFPTIDKRIKRLISEFGDIKIMCAIKAVFAKFEKDGSEFFQFHPMENYLFNVTSVVDNGTSGQWTLEYKEIFSLNVPRDLSTKYRNPSAK